MQVHQCIYIYVHIYTTRLQWYSKHICTLGVLIEHMAMAYATSMLPIYIYMRRSSWDINIYLKTPIYMVYRHNCILAARLLYTVISEIISSLSTITWFFHAPDQTISSKFITCSKNGTHPLHIKHVCCYFPFCYFFDN